ELPPNDVCERAGGRDHAALKTAQCKVPLAGKQANRDDDARDLEHPRWDRLRQLAGIGFPVAAEHEQRNEARAPPLELALKTTAVAVGAHDSSSSLFFASLRFFASSARTLLRAISMIVAWCTSRSIAAAVAIGVLKIRSQSEKTRLLVMIRLLRS